MIISNVLQIWTFFCDGILRHFLYLIFYKYAILKYALKQKPEVKYWNCSQCWLRIFGSVQWEYIWDGACKKMEFRENVWQHAELWDQGWTESLPGTQADQPSDHLLPVIWICQLPTIWISSSSNVDFIFRQYGFPSSANNQARMLQFCEWIFLF